MAEGKTNRDALSRALGAAYLSHQVEQLEKTVSTSPRTVSANPRRERVSSPTGDAPRGRGGGRRGGGHGRGRGGRPHVFDGEGRDDSDRGSDVEDKAVTIKKAADVVVVDASVLVHALGQVKVWCRNNRDEIVVVPLEALNTLDILKKGSTPLAQRARAASRILEQQVGTNSRIRVQRDDAFVLWDEIPLKDADVTDAAAADAKPALQAPEWLRRTICCARWELDHAQARPADGDAKEPATDAKSANEPKMVFAICLASIDAKPQVDANQSATSPVPVPLPVPQLSRCTGTLVSLWAEMAGIPVLEVKPTPPPSASRSGPRTRTSSAARHMRGSSDEEWRGPPAKNVAPIGRAGVIGIKPRANEPVPEKQGAVYGPGRAGGGGLVERPAATMAMNASMMQPSKVIRVLARGEKLDP